MPAILRIFLYQTDASLSLLGLCGSYGQYWGEEAGGGADVDLQHLYRADLSNRSYIGC